MIIKYTMFNDTVNHVFALSEPEEAKQPIQTQITQSLMSNSFNNLN